MAIFKSKSKFQKAEDHAGHHERKMGGGDGKFRTLEAVKELQPFEEATNLNTYGHIQLYLSQESGELKDIFGNKIETPDILNPTRNRNERPLDTIRAFEYAISGDLAYQDQLESHQIGWEFHRDFPYQNYMNSQLMAETLRGNYNASVNGYVNAQNYQPVDLGSRQQNDKKKKKGLFGRSK
ncbi:hypothetical protein METBISCDRAFT_19107 [Metschnikowia bicuspidata]|uniref:Uncharacterized protein n=1 Tax=Metschnikowia bicuspidata TaxID=27322 RepID=A0A4V1J2P1_9ASCO|nr:hypothetical protein METBISCDRAFT_19107 [Metschnikowia bicuspidata]